MIPQKDIRAALKACDQVEQLQRSEAVQAYLQAKLAADNLLGTLKRRVVAGETVEAGKHGLSLKSTRCVSWEKVWTALGAIPAIATAFARSKPAQAVLAQAVSKDLSAPFVSQRHELVLVVVDP